MGRFKLVPPAVLVVAALVAGSWLLGRAMNREARQEQEGAALLDAVMQRVRDTYVEDVTEDQLWQAAVSGMIDELGDPNSAYLTPDRLERLAQASANAYRGVGLLVDVRDGWITVAQPRPGSPAERAGIQAGDRLAEIDGRSMRGWTVGEARSALRGPLGSTVNLVSKASHGLEH